MSITKVSQIAGVSIATVSRVINGNASVSAGKASAVRAAMEKVGYQVPTEDKKVGRPRRDPSGIRHGAIAVLFPDPDRNALRTALSGRLLQGIELALQRRSLTMVVTGLTEAGELPACIERRQLDGVIIRGTSLLAGLGDLSRRLPCVGMFDLTDDAQVSIDTAVEDNAAIGSMAAHWLLARSHRRLAFINRLPGHPSFRVRRMFFHDVASRLGAQVSVFQGDVPVAELAGRFLAEPQRPTGLFVPGADNDVIQVCQVLRAGGVEVGRDVDLIVCHNDFQQLAAIDPRLPNIDIAPEAIGGAAVDLLLWRLRHPKESPRRLVIPPVMIAPLAPSSNTASFGPSVAPGHEG